MTITQIINRICKSSKQTVDARSITSVLVSIFVRDNALNIERFPNLILVEANADKQLINLVEKRLSAHGLRISLHDLVTCFESLVSQDEKKEKGIVYTPLEIKEYIIKKTIKDRKDVPFLCDPSCGCGSFLITAAELFHEQYKKSYFDLFTKYLYGVDIDSHAINRAKILIDLLLCMNKENPIKQYHLICADMLDPQTSLTVMKDIPTGFDCIVGNPPYVRNRNVSERTKKYFSCWDCGKSGNMDLYMPFYEIGLKLLNFHGQLTYISPNTFLQAVNGRGLRNYFKTYKVSLEIIDFRDSQIFKNVTSYTCITSACLGKNGYIRYARMKENEELGQQHFTSYKMSNFANDQPWRLCDSVHDNIIYKIEHAGKPLGTWKIRNGLATLKNDLFFFIPSREDSLYYYRFENDLEYKIEKAICIDIVKPNTIKTEEDLENMAKMLRLVAPAFESSPVELAIESVLSPKQYADLFSYVGSNKMKIYYDTQNPQYFASVYPPDEMRELDISTVAEIHFKDGLRKSQGSVYYGEGETGFADMVSVLKEKGYEGYLVIENFYNKVTWSHKEESVWASIKEDVKRLKQAFSD